jgi:hypothetical protein
MTATTKTKRGDSGRSFIVPNRRVSTFLGCLVLAAGFWFLNMLTKSYTTTMRVPIRYEHPPGDRLIAVELPDSAEAEIRANGFTLLAFRLWRQPGAITLDLREARSIKGTADYVLAVNRQNESSARQLGRGLRLLRLRPDTIVLSYSGKITKRVPIRPKVLVTCAPSFRLGDSILTNPAFVDITGAEAILQKIEFVETESRTYQDLDHDVQEKVAILRSTDLEQVDINPAQVLLRIPVGRYTEGKMSVPVELINVPTDVVLRTFPDKVDVLFQVPVEAFNNIRPEMFRIVIDYTKIGTEKTARLELMRQPIQVRNIRIVPEQVEYIIRK